MTAPKTSTAVLHVVQGSFAFGSEWDSWQDMPDVDQSGDIYAAIGKAELFMHFMLHGTYPEQYKITPNLEPLLAVMQEVRNEVIKTRGTTGHKFRLRVVRRTIASTITDEVVDPATIVKHGEKT